ncbi:hypothetical protein B6S12_09205 [Helicobacter valdiviensis]|uniref:Campylobacter invasion antigen D C-terminal domain-containing protein n=1 Tax=Helicobacter valdiviensis TaxID=1458358 RepID=A0A2W6MSK5_9HELI|nr:hypothetical protein [Helicobacter valdiviensis]PZT47402.1 hypothetical protein B6S12_09205 [Helicobacter valdiviensis]
MELKEAILQTLAEIDTNSVPTQEEPIKERDALLEVLPQDEILEAKSQEKNPYERKIAKLDLKDAEELKEQLIKFYQQEENFLNSLQERILVLFEGMQSPNNRNIEDKVDMILNFLEFVLAIIDEKRNNL